MVVKVFCGYLYMARGAIQLDNVKLVVAKSLSTSPSQVKRVLRALVLLGSYFTFYGNKELCLWNYCNSPVLCHWFNVPQEERTSHCNLRHA
ncbi:hypothetical protein H5410_047643 [Solanum commersonii]|uniref:Uncharacterized protein n=1 Tax=Solanum commersonii TaxID=4109 RepID=A0A9J5XFQ4_SOLCO|nr:hypothetical protein H5410_047643 [Solanum commersonii]